MEKNEMGIAEKTNVAFNVLRAFGRPLGLVFAEGPGVRHVENPLDTAWSLGFLTAFGVFGQSDVVLCGFLPAAVIAQAAHKARPGRNVPSFSMGWCALDRVVGAGKGWNVLAVLSVGCGAALHPTDKAAGLYLCLAGLGLGMTVAMARARQRAIDQDIEDGLIEQQSRAARLNQPFFRR